MSNRPSRVIVTALTVLLTAGSGAVLASPGEAATSAARAKLLTASLAGGGDSDGSGYATLTMRARRGLVCVALSWQGIQRPSAGHVHRVSDGAVVVTLTSALADGTGCAAAPSAVIRAINASPRAYYVNLHNTEHAGGAVQGVLR